MPLKFLKKLPLSPLQRGFLILLIPILVLMALFFPRGHSKSWMDTALEAIEYHNAEQIHQMIDAPGVSLEECAAFITTLETEFWPLIRYTPGPNQAISREVEVVAQLPEIPEGMESTKIWTTVVDGHGRKGIFTLYVTPKQDEILAMELIAESKPESLTSDH